MITFGFGDQNGKPMFLSNDFYELHPRLFAVSDVQNLPGHEA